jgi:hypothetical protein
VLSGDVSPNALLDGWQTLNLRSVHPYGNQAHYTVASNFSMAVRVQDFNRSMCVPQSQAVSGAECAAMPGFFVPVSQIISIPPTEGCVSIPAASGELGLAIRAQRSASSQALVTLHYPDAFHIRARYEDGVAGSSYNDWLYVTGYYAGNQYMSLPSPGWVANSIYIDGGKDACSPTNLSPYVKYVSDLPIINDLGTLVPTATPTITPTSISTPVGGPICSVHPANPTPVRENAYTASAIVGNITLPPSGIWPLIDVKAVTNQGEQYYNSRDNRQSTTWYQIYFTDEGGNFVFGWVQEHYLDSADVATLCVNPPIPTVVATVPPTPTPTPSPTLPPDLSNNFLLPMRGPDDAHPPRLSRCQIHDEIASMDINPLNASGGNYPLQLPAPATIMIVDNDGDGTLGNFVSIRIDMADIPQVIRQRLETLNEVPNDDYPNFRNRFGNIDTSQGGSIHIGYAHLSSIESDIAPTNIEDGISPNEILPPGKIIGYTGDSGRSDGTHLHISAFYISDNPIIARPHYFYNWGAKKDSAGVWVLDPYFSNLEHDYDGLFVMHQMGFDPRKETLFGRVVDINPLVLWPILEAQTSCPFVGPITTAGMS